MCQGRPNQPQKQKKGVDPHTITTQGNACQETNKEWRKKKPWNQEKRQQITKKKKKTNSQYFHGKTKHKSRSIHEEGILMSGTLMRKIRRKIKENPGGLECKGMTAKKPKRVERKKMPVAHPGVK